MLETLKSHKYLILFNVVYIVGFTALFVAKGDYEFLWYVAVLVALAGLVVATLGRSQFDDTILWGLSIWGFLHMAGGGIVIGDHVLYAEILIPLVDAGSELVLLKYDQLVHFFGFAVATLVVYHLLRPHLTRTANRTVILVIVALAGTGLGVVNELVEFSAVLVFAETGVGGYYNTALDLVFNTLGAATAALYIHLYREERVYASE